MILFLLCLIIFMSLFARVCFSLALYSSLPNDLSSRAHERGPHRQGTREQSPLALYLHQLILDVLMTMLRWWGWGRGWRRGEPGDHLTSSSSLYLAGDWVITRGHHSGFGFLLTAWMLVVSRGLWHARRCARQAGMSSRGRIFSVPLVRVPCPPRRSLGPGSSPP